MQESSVIKIKDEKGKIKECKVLYTFTTKKENKTYIVYTDSKKEKETLNIHAAILKEDKDKKELLPIKTNEEWFTIEAILDKLKEMSKEG